jgi:hypothetical protein
VTLIGARWSNGGAVMPRDVGIGPIDRRLVKAGLDDPGLPFSSRSRNNSRILRIDSLSAGILFPAFRQKEQAYLRRTSDVGKYP